MNKLENELRDLTLSLDVCIKVLKRANLYKENRPVQHLESMGLYLMSSRLKQLITLRNNKMIELVESIKNEVA